MVLLKTKETKTEDNLNSFFIQTDAKRNQSFQEMMFSTIKMLTDTLDKTEEPYSGKTPLQIKEMLEQPDLYSFRGETWETVLEDVRRYAVEPAIKVQHPACMAHLQCPVVNPSIAAELILSTLNQSMDSWDQSPAATYLEDRLVKWMIELTGLPETGDGVFTSGGTQSNYMGLQLARDNWCQKKLGHSVKTKGLPKEAERFRILCSEDAHFTVKKSAVQLGLGEQAVTTIKTNNNKEIDGQGCLSTVKELKKDGLLPIAIVATAGTTDFGSIDSLMEIADIAAAEGLWFHIDAAYGGGLLFSDQHKKRLTGIERADSVTIDFHKMLFQPVSCGIFLVKEAGSLTVNSQQADYLSPTEDEECGMLHLVDKSVQTSRRFDALKLWMTLRQIGIRTLGEWIEQIIDLTKKLHDEIAQKQAFELALAPSISTLVFRYIPETEIPETMVDQLNRSIKNELFYEGQAVLSKTKVHNKQFLKITLLHPGANFHNGKQVLEAIIQKGQTLEEKWRGEEIYG
ncbi:aspartate aminotransferase family protein [Alteribacillus sp. YIM 98480]|uniref:pyridoxal phosphate-dependent decarboxylase family protein n=1 Tax=Alteribacillus sp. YIM 98480 TaxID=2606599 RepID=UPI00131DD397|nr:aspartate aminotransferase family protein [Alteribacillus sp. YIM 98480]